MRTLAYFGLAVKVFSLVCLRGGVLSGMMPCMVEEKKVLRLTESIPGRLAGVLLALLWVFSMGGVDAHAFSSFPVCVVLAVVVGLVVLGLLLGYRVVRMSWLGWVSLLIGGYFLLRCLNSYAVVDSWCEAVLILGAFVYYVAGVYAAQSRSYAYMFYILGAVLLLNMLAFVVVRQPWFCLEWLGRAPQTQSGGNLLPATLLGYKNFAGVFMCLGGVLVGVWGMWMQRGWQRIIWLLVAFASLVVSFMCGTRAVYILLPALLILVWGLHVTWRMATDRKLRWFDFMLIITLVSTFGVFVYSLLCGGAVSEIIKNTDSHLRYLIWSSICEILPSVPVFGCGANTAQWEIVPYYCEWQLPNYAHNEYLQAWVDYGFVGLLLVLFIVLSHTIWGIRCLFSEHVSNNRVVFVVACCLVLVGIAAYAVVDFPWHSFALVSLTAFAAGGLSSPYLYRQFSIFSCRSWAAGHAPVVPVTAQKWLGKMVLVFLAIGLGGCSVYLGKKLQAAWVTQWEYNALCQPGVDPRGDARRECIAREIATYPSPTLADTYFMLPPYNPDYAEREYLLRTAMAGNPRQLFMVIMLADVLGQQQKFIEAEQLMREHYVGEAMPASLLSNWPAYYAYNLLIWGRYEMQQGNHAKALSLMEYALKIHEVSALRFDVTWRKGDQPWNEYGGIKPGFPQLLQTVKRDVHMLRLIGTLPDDSWQQPMTPGGKPAMYRKLVNRER